MLCFFYSLVQSSTGGHAAGQTSDPSLLEVWDAGNIGSDGSHGVRGVHEKAVFTQNHVTVLKGRTRGQVTKMICSV